MRCVDSLQRGRVFERVVLAQVARTAYYHTESRTEKASKLCSFSPLRVDKLEKLYSYLLTAGEDTRLFSQATAPEELPLPAQSCHSDTKVPPVASTDDEVVLKVAPTFADDFSRYRWE